MTEEKWLTGNDPAAMVMLRSATGSARKRRLYACACVRRVWRCLRDERSRQAVEVAERFADGDTKKGELKRANAAALDAAVTLPAEVPSNHKPRFAASAAYCACKASVPPSTARIAAHESDVASGERDRAAQAGLLRCVFGNPYRTAIFAEAWRTPTVVGLAQAAYDERALPSGELDAERLSVLADALEEAGCSADVHGHLREAGPHVRGCWAVDLALGRE